MDRARPGRLTVIRCGEAEHAYDRSCAGPGCQSVRDAERAARAGGAELAYVNDRVVEQARQVAALCACGKPCDHSASGR